MSRLLSQTYSFPTKRTRIHVSSCIGRQSQRGLVVGWSTGAAASWASCHVWKARRPSPVLHHGIAGTNTVSLHLDSSVGSHGAFHAEHLPECSLVAVKNLKVVPSLPKVRGEICSARARSTSLRPISRSTNPMHIALASLSGRPLWIA